MSLHRGWGGSLSLIKHISVVVAVSHQGDPFSLLQVPCGHLNHDRWSETHTLLPEGFLKWKVFGK